MPLFNWFARIWISLAAVFTPLSGAHKLFANPSPTPTPIPTYEVTKVLEGDAIEVKMGTESAKIHLIGISAPQPSSGECLGKTATDKLSELIGQNRVTLEEDTNFEIKKPEGYLYRYVSVNNKDLSTELLSLGLGHYYTENTNGQYKLRDQLKNAETNARDNKVGLWNPNSCRPTGYCLVVPVLMYHHIQPTAEATKLGHAALTVDSGIFEHQLEYLNNNHYTFITVAQLANAIHSHQSLPGKTVAITIDDGYDDAYNYAYPLLRKYGAIASLFVPTGLVGNPGYLNWGQVSEMNGSGVLMAYDHTWSHNSLPSGTYEKALYEITTAQTQLEEHLGNIAKVFAYPYGSSNNTDISILAQQGFQAAFTTVPGRWQCEGNIFQLPRLRVGNSTLSAYGL